MGWTAQIVRHPPKLAPEEEMRMGVREWAKEGVGIALEKLLPPKDSRAFLLRRWVVERIFSWLGQNRRMSKDYERLAATSEAFVYVAMSRLMVSFGSLMGLSRRFHLGRLVNTWLRRLR